MKCEFELKEVVAKKKRAYFGKAKELKNIILLILVHQLYFCCNHVHKEWTNLNMEQIGYDKPYVSKALQECPMGNKRELSVFGESTKTTLQKMRTLNLHQYKLKFCNLSIQCTFKRLAFLSVSNNLYK